MSSDKDGTVRICHLSDLHLPLTKGVALWRLIGKRALGFLNLKLNRGRTYKTGAFCELLIKAVEERADLVAITGDITSLAFDFEFEEASRLFLEAGLNPKNTVIIPGNHDRYTADADLGEAFERGLASWLPDAFAREAGYPFVTRVGPVALIALDTAIWRNPLRAAGNINRSQIARLADLLESELIEGLWPVIAMHNPPFHLSEALLRNFRNGLDGCDELVSALGEIRATVLHGHLHKFSRRRIGNLEVIGVPAASNDSGDESTQLGYCVYTFGASGLKQAEAVRYWPNKKNERFERFELPQEMLVD
jgi:3',5'-cyclic AMP phosphodiesterase CpdA